MSNDINWDELGLVEGDTIDVTLRGTYYDRGGSGQGRHALQYQYDDGRREVLTTVDTSMTLQAAVKVELVCPKIVDKALYQNRAGHLFTGALYRGTDMLETLDGEQTWKAGELIGLRRVKIVPYTD